ncbi:MAG: Crp/Fnr family transcriptional regulator [Candidatus Brocadiales bacterium]
MKTLVDKYIKNVPAKRVFVRANNFIFSEMDASYGMYFIESGTVKILKGVPESGKDMNLATLGPNEFFGEMSLLTRRPHSTNALATKDCALWVLDEKAFKEAIAKNPEFSLLIMRTLAKRLLDMNDKMRDLFSQIKDFTEKVEEFSTIWHAFAP